MEGGRGSSGRREEDEGGRGEARIIKNRHFTYGHVHVHTHTHTHTKAAYTWWPPVDPTVASRSFPGAARGHVQTDPSLSGATRGHAEADDGSSGATAEAGGNRDGPWNRNVPVSAHFLGIHWPESNSDPAPHDDWN